MIVVGFNNNNKIISFEKIDFIFVLSVCRYFPEYSKDNCLLECEVAESVKRCGCQPFMYPAKEGDRICQASSIPCLILHFGRFRLFIYACVEHG